MSDRVARIEALHRQYASVLYSLACRMLGDSGEAEDAVQETFLTVFRKADRFEVQETFISAYRSFDRLRGDDPFPWLVRIATNSCLMILRTRRRKGTASLEAPELVADRQGGAERRFATRRFIERLIDELDERSQHIVVAHFVHGMDQGQIAESLGISRRAVVKRLARLRAEYGPLVASTEVGT